MKIINDKWCKINTNDDIIELKNDSSKILMVGELDIVVVGKKKHETIQPNGRLKTIQMTHLDTNAFTNNLNNIYFY